MNLALDLGNSRWKAGVFDKKELVHAESGVALSVEEISHICNRFSIQYSVLSSVIEPVAHIELFLKSHTQYLKLRHGIPLPFKNLYESPETLGTDRIAGLAGALRMFSDENVLVVSAGTCITYDVIESNAVYYGGNITPGIDMRLKAMNTFTARLPLVQKEMTSDLIGRSTRTSMLTGAVQGAQLEMVGFIKAYQKKYSLLTVVLTGGDAGFFETITEYKIFAVPHLVLHGLNEILLLNHATKA